MTLTIFDSGCLFLLVNKLFLIDTKKKDTRIHGFTSNFNVPNNTMRYLFSCIRSLIFQLRQQARYLLSQLFVIRVHLLSVRVE